LFVDLKWTKWRLESQHTSSRVPQKVIAVTIENAKIFTDDNPLFVELKWDQKEVWKPTHEFMSTMKSNSSYSRNSKIIKIDIERLTSQLGFMSTKNKVNDQQKELMEAIKKH